MIGIAIVGAGTWGETHCKSLTSLEDPGVQIHSISDIVPGKAQALAETYGIKHAYTDYRDALAYNEVTAVIIATPDHLHTQIAIDAANAKKHILVEKPLATTSKDCLAIIDAVEANKVIAMVDFHGRWNPVLHFAKNALVANELGTLRYITATLSNRMSFPLERLRWAEKNGLLWFLGCHVIDLMHWFIGKEPSSVYAVRREGALQAHGLQAADFFLITLEFPGGVVVTLEHSWLLPKADPSIKEYEMKIVGEKGTLNLDLSHHRAVELITDTTAFVPEMFAAPVVYGKNSGFVKTSLQHFLECVADNTKPFVGVHEGLVVTKIIEKIIESADGRKKVFF